MRNSLLLTTPGILLLVFFTNNLLFSQEVYKASPVNFLEAAKFEKLHPIKAEKNDEKAENNMQKLPGNLPLPAGAIVKPFNDPALYSKTAKVNAPIPMKLSPAPVANFLGAKDNGVSIPPDGGGAVGPNHIFSAENELFVIRNKAGTLISSVTPVTFFNGLVPGFSADPHVKYDQYSGRWIVIGQTDVDTLSSLVIAVSQTSDPTGNYNRYVVRIDPLSAQVADFPLLGYNKDWIVITTNLFNLDVTAFTGTSLFVLDKATLYSGGAIDFSKNAFRQLSESPDGSNPCPMVSFSTDSIGDEMYLLQSWNASAGILRLSKVSGNLPNISWPTNVVYPKFTAGWTFDGGDIAPQLNDERKINTGDARIQTVVERNGLLWACHTITLNGRTVIQWMQLSPTGNILQTNRIAMGGANAFRAYPSLAVTADESVIIGYNLFSTSAYASAAYSYRNAGTPYNTLDSEVVYKKGLSSYYKTFSGDRNRWGDYSSSAVDPVTGNLWTIQEIADQKSGTASDSSRFATWWAAITPSFANVRIDAALTGVSSPLTGITLCDSVIHPSVTLKNNGIDTLKTVSINMLLDGTPLGAQYNFTGSIAALNSIDISLTPFTAPPGNHTLQIFSTNPNGTTDQRNLNDDVSVTFTILQTLALPAAEGFESTVFPPPGGWAISNPDADITWERTTAAAKTGNASMRINGFYYSSVLSSDIFKSPGIRIAGLDSVYVSFDVAYAKANAQNILVDTLEVVYSPDCGVTWLPAGYKKWGAALATNGGAIVSDQPFVPASSQWRNDTASLSTCGIVSDNILVGIKFINNFGQDCFIDNVAIRGVSQRQNNVQLMSINKPVQTLCTNTFTPQLTFSNQAHTTLKTLKINYKVDNEPAAVFNFTGSVAGCTSQNVTLNPVTSIPGTHVLTVYTANPNGNPDEASQNDTLRLPFIISANADAPVAEGFENASFPPNNWTVLNLDGSLTWEKTNAAAKSGTSSMVIKNFDYPVFNTTDKFISPIVTVAPSVDSVFASFDYAYAAGNRFPGSSLFPADTLEIQLTQDCGQTFTTLWKKWGADLQSSNGTVDTSIAFVPTVNDWQNVKLYLTPFIGNQNFQIYFVAKSNRRNNLYVDNINIYTITLPAKLKSQGYLLYPNPFSSVILIQHYQPPVNLKSISIYNSVGQMILQRQYTGNANSQIPLNLSYLARGIYVVKLNYTDKTIVQRIVKE